MHTRITSVSISEVAYKDFIHMSKCSASAKSDNNKRVTILTLHWLLHPSLNHKQGSCMNKSLSYLNMLAVATSHIYFSYMRTFTSTQVVLWKFVHSVEVNTLDILHGDGTNWVFLKQILLATITQSSAPPLPCSCTFICQWTCPIPT